MEKYYSGAKKLLAIGGVVWVLTRFITPKGRTPAAVTRPTTPLQVKWEPERV